ncbi:hypothetical protein TRVL_01135 [Trypanosoma vivax]|uniref:Sel1 repeat family protein n=1 Tax=Trypanosoma vivax (strain Y486) TaxID=1055687 RepID=G0U008_TRYVY|nr:hypothetical protein TRVL_01135 [Trypanosoma vivax]CCC49405.1 conserved hypothetical protein [Trypanosoma vivax Y486]
MANDVPTANALHPCSAGNGQSTFRTKKFIMPHAPVVAAPLSHSNIEDQLRYMLLTEDLPAHAVLENDVRQVLAELQRRRQARRAVVPPSRSSSLAAFHRPHVMALVQACEAPHNGAALDILRSFLGSCCPSSGKDLSRALVAVPLAELLLQRREHTEDVQYALSLLDEASAAGHVGAMLLVGLCLRDGVGVPADLIAALTWVERAADAGYAPAMFELGVMFEDGVVCGDSQLPSDWGDAQQWYRRAAEHGHTMAQLNLGKLLWRAAAGVGQGVCGEHMVSGLKEQSLEWLGRAAASGNEEAMRLLRCKQ